MKVFNNDQIFTTNLNSVLTVKIVFMIQLTLSGSLGSPRKGNPVILPTLNYVGRLPTIDSIKLSFVENDFV